MIQQKQSFWTWWLFDSRQLVSAKETLKLVQLGKRHLKKIFVHFDVLVAWYDTK